MSVPPNTHTHTHTHTHTQLINLSGSVLTGLRGDGTRTQLPARPISGQSSQFPQLFNWADGGLQSRIETSITLQPRAMAKRRKEELMLITEMRVDCVHTCLLPLISQCRGVRGH